MTRSTQRAIGLGAGLLMVFGGAAGVADAKKSKSKGKITADAQKESRLDARRLARTFVVRKQGPSAVFAARPPYGRTVARSTKKLAGFPRSGKSYMIMSTGDALLADNKDSSGSSGVNAGGPTIRGARDVTIFRVNLQVPKGRNCLSFRFRFLTEEYPEFVNEIFNDGFLAELDDTTWDTNTIGSPIISAPKNFAKDSMGNRISVNSAGDNSVSAAEAKGTTYDGATRVLRASTPITSGKHRLYLSVFDQGDRQYDSAAFIDKLSLTKSSKCTTGVRVD